MGIKKALPTADVHLPLDIGKYLDNRSLAMLVQVFNRFADAGGHVAF